MNKKVFTITETQEALGLARNTVMSLINNGKLRAVRAGRRWLIPSEAIDAYLRGA